jgi:putative PEP-CTERM system histidine kinase
MTDTDQIGAFGYAIAMVVFAFLTVLSLSVRRRSDWTGVAAFATAISAIWAGSWTAGYLEFVQMPAPITFVELTRVLGWLIAVVALARAAGLSIIWFQIRSTYGVFVLSVAIFPVAYLWLRSAEPFVTLVWVAGGYVLSVLIILSAEQIYRNAPLEQRPSLNYLCVAVCGLFIFDLFMYVAVIAGAEVNSDYLASRGFVNAILAVPLALGIGRRSRAAPDGRAPRQMVFYSFGVTILAAYVAVVTIGYHYVQQYGGSWSAVGGIFFLVAAIAVALTLLASGTIRARVRVQLMKTFFQYKYDYRKEWLRFIATLSESGLENVSATAVRAVAQIVNSPGGVVWIQDPGSETYVPFGAWHCAIPEVNPVNRASDLIRFLAERQWVIDLEEMKRFPARYEELQLESWLAESTKWWLIVPVFLGKRLYGFVALEKSRFVPALNFEDHDLLRTAGRHIGMHINQAESDKQLAESQQFGAYNRLTAFLMHDLNNLIAQQSLVVKNAERFRRNPEFVDDAIDTIAHSVTRMKRLMAQLSSNSKPTVKRHTDVRATLTKAVDRCQVVKPVPRLEMEDTPMIVQADAGRLVTVFEHLIRNAQDATPANGEIGVDARVASGEVIVSITDTGKGMTSQFIRERLFRPFDSTKGSESMGIGAYQAREYVRSLQGTLDVTSSLGEGTQFVVRLPVHG